MIAITADPGCDLQNTIPLQVRDKPSRVHTGQRVALVFCRHGEMRPLATPASKSTKWPRRRQATCLAESYPPAIGAHKTPSVVRDGRIRMLARSVGNGSVTAFAQTRTKPPSPARAAVWRELDILGERTRSLKPLSPSLSLFCYGSSACIRGFYSFFIASCSQFCSRNYPGLRHVP